MQDKLEILQKWANASREKDGFDDSLRSLLYYACIEILRQNSILKPQISPKDAFLAVLPYASEPIALWNDTPLSHENEILVFAAETHKVNIPQSTDASTLDLRGVACPECSMRARTIVANMPQNTELTILLDSGSPAENVPASLVADGHSIQKREKKENFWQYSVLK